MTTAHRPTWKAAVGQSNEGGWAAGGAVSHQTSVLDAPAHLHLKTRRAHQQVLDKKAALQQSLLALEVEEHKATVNKNAKTIGKRPVDAAIEELGRQRLLMQTAEIDVQKIKDRYDDSDAASDTGNKNNAANSSSSESDLDDSDGFGSSDSDDDDEEDEEAALQAELAKIRAEREELKKQKEAKEAAADSVELQHAASLGNPLLAAAANNKKGSQHKRRWNDDAVFRHQAKSEPAPKKRFINDTVRNDFHRRFLNKFIR